MSETQLPAKIAGVSSDVIGQVKELQKTYSLAAMIDMDEVEKSFTIAQGIARMTELVHSNKEIVTCLMYMQGKKLGFKTDKEYDEKTVVQCYVESTIRGLQMSGNQWNIIAGNFYQTKEGFDYVLENLPDFTDWWIEWGDYKLEKQTAKVDFEASWTYKGTPQKMKGWVPVRVNTGSIVDAIYGKAERKVMARVLKKITKSSAYSDERDITEIDVTAVEVTQETKVITAGDGKISGGK